jgi:hypothetical protein
VLVIAFAMVPVLVLAALVITYVAFPHRGQRLHRVPWLSDAMERAAEAAPLIDRERVDAVPRRRH